MRKILLILLIACSQQLVAQIYVQVSGNIFNTDAEKVTIGSYDGEEFTPILEGTRHVKDKGKNGSKGKKGDFLVSGELPIEDYYFLRIDEQDITLVLRDSAQIKVYADAKRLGQFMNIIGSDESNNINKFNGEIEAWRIKIDSARAELEEFPDRAEEINKRMETAQMRFQQTQKLYAQQNRNSAALIALIPLIDPMVDKNGFTDVIRQLHTGFGQAPTVKELVEYAAQLDPLAPGKPAPDFEEMKVDSTMMKLSDLRGKVVLLDFWASWCGPCRKENPNVVNLYHKYKDQGFTVMSVSLDSDRNRWLMAIEQDGLVWPNHVSDLKKWSSAAAKKYGVGSIPFTVLIDREGNIIGTKLRGPELEQALKAIFEN